MATPHVAGFAAYLLSFDSALTPAQIATVINEKSLKDVLTGVREYFSLHIVCLTPGALKSTLLAADGTVNKLLNNKL